MTDVGVLYLLKKSLFRCVSFKKKTLNYIQHLYNKTPDYKYNKVMHKRFNKSHYCLNLTSHFILHAYFRTQDLFSIKILYVSVFSALD